MKRIKTKNLLLTVLVATVLLLTANAVNAGTVLSLDQMTKDVQIGGTVDFIITTNDGPGMIDWEINPSDPIKAKLSSQQLWSKSGIINVKSSPQTFTLTVTTENGAEIGKEYPIVLTYYCSSIQCYNKGTVIVKATAGVIPTPELSPSVLTAIGLIGLIGLVRMRRKD